MTTFALVAGVAAELKVQQHPTHEPRNVTQFLCLCHLQHLTSTLRDRYAHRMANTCDNDDPIMDTVCVLEKLVVRDGGHRLSEEAPMSLFQRFKSLQS